MTRRLMLLQTGLLAIGAAYAWTTIIMRFAALAARFGTILTIGDSTTTNPVLTPCFYGGSVFVIALVWSFFIYSTMSLAQERYLSYLLLFGTLFAASVISVEMCQYYRIFGGPLIACTPGVYPLYGPCAIGGSFYLLSFITSRFVLRFASRNDGVPSVRV